MARRRFRTAHELAAELDCTVGDGIDAVLAVRLLIVAPPREAVARMPARGERGGGYDLTGALAYVRSGLDDWLPAYLEEREPVDDPARAADHGRPYDDGLRLYVRPDAMAKALAGRFNPSPRADVIVDRLRAAGAVRGRVLGIDQDTEVGRLVWWRIPSPLRSKLIERRNS